MPGFPAPVLPMTKTPLARALAALLTGSCLLPAASPVRAEPVDRSAEKQPQPVLVHGEIVYRDRAEEPATLVYDLEYFQRFEPITVGDMLKRVPSVAFLSDVLEYDGVRLRGLDAAYTQILINGKRVPGSGLDRSFFVDRIPAELVERIEISRSASADRSGDAVAGSLNIVLRDGYSLEGGYLRAGALHYSDDEIEPNLSVVWGGKLGDGRLLLGANAQGRRNPKQKYSQRFDEPAGELDNSERQTDVRSGEDYSFNADYQLPVGEGELALSAFFVRTDRLQDEDSIEYAGGEEVDESIAVVNDNDLDIRTDNWSLGVEYALPMAGGETRLRFGQAGIDDDQFEFENEFEYLRDDTPFPDADRFTGDRVDLRIKDRETSIELRHLRELANATELRFGLDSTRKQRDTAVLEGRNRFNLPEAPTPLPPIPGEFDPLEPVPGGVNRIDEDRIEPFARLSGERGALEWELGGRWQFTDLSIRDFTVDAEASRHDRDFDAFLPSAHLRWNLDDDRRVTASLARTLRRAGFDQLSPALLEGELGDNDLLGNPELEPEDAWGIDLGYELRLGRRGVIGVNLFYRDIQDLIEIANTGEEGDEGPGTFVLQPRNSGDGQVWGAELDVSTPLTLFGLDDTGVFFNYSWLDSEITDLFGTRRFNSQSNYVMNIGFIQELRSIEASFGLSYRKQGDAWSRIVGEEVRTAYDGDLEAYVEKRFGERWAVRLTGSNLLDASKDEVFDKFPTIDDQIDRSYDEFELETESAGRVYQLTLRYAF